MHHQICVDDILSTCNFLKYWYRYLHRKFPYTKKNTHTKWKHMGVSKNRGTPKWMVYNGKPYEQMDDLGGFPIFLETPICPLASLFTQNITASAWWGIPKKSPGHRIPVQKKTDQMRLERFFTYDWINVSSFLGQLLGKKQRKSNIGHLRDPPTFMKISPIWNPGTTRWTQGVIEPNLQRSKTLSLAGSFLPFFLGLNQDQSIHVLNTS